MKNSATTDLGSSDTHTIQAQLSDISQSSGPMTGTRIQLITMLNLARNVSVFIAAIDACTDICRIQYPDSVLDKLRSLTCTLLVSILRYHAWITIVLPDEIEAVLRLNEMSLKTEEFRLLADEGTEPRIIAAYELLAMSGMLEVLEESYPELRDNLKYIHEKVGIEFFARLSDCAIAIHKELLELNAIISETCNESSSITRMDITPAVISHPMP